MATAQAVPVVMPVQQEGSQPILPPRTTARSVAVVRPHSLWRSWPMLVIILAVIAIVTATVIMIMPPGAKHGDGKMSAPPAPERMETNPLPDKSSQLDPWDNGVPGSVPHAQPQPQAPSPAAPDPDPDDDIWGGSAGGGGGGGIAGGFGGGGASFMISALDHACKKMKACPNADQSMLASVCDAVSVMPKPPAPTNCPAAQRCFDSIDKMSCADATQATPHSVFTMFTECTEAARC
ncbi:MAG TPA: hypothetical protein VIV40_14530 [Kofleriaceae bacterium]